jgi:hypothetical protein
MLPLTAIERGNDSFVSTNVISAPRLPPEIFLHIFNYITNPPDIIRLQLACRQFKDLSEYCHKNIIYTIDNLIKSIPIYGQNILPFQKIISSPKVNPADRENLPLKTAVNCHQNEVVERLLKDDRVYSALCTRPQLNWAISRNSSAMVKRIMENPPFDPAFDNNKALRKAAENGFTDIVKSLIANQKISTQVSGYCEAIASALRQCRGATVVALVKNPHPDFSLDALLPHLNSKCVPVVRFINDSMGSERSLNVEVQLYAAVLYNQFDVFASLLRNPEVDSSFISNILLKIENPRFDPAFDNNKALRIAAENGFTDSVKSLIANQKISTQVSGYCEAIASALKQGHGATVLALVKNPHPDFSLDAILPHLNSKCAPVVRFINDSMGSERSLNVEVQLYAAVLYNKFNVVASLLQNPEVDPSFIRNILLKTALIGIRDLNIPFYLDPVSGSDIIDLLLKDARIDPNADDHYVLKTALSRGNGDIVGVLLNNPRFHPDRSSFDKAIETCKIHDEHLSNILLRYRREHLSTRTERLMQKVVTIWDRICECIVLPISIFIALIKAIPQLLRRRA